MNTTNHTSPSGEELKPCPFCGCTTSPELKGNGIGDNWLECVECGASTRLREDGAGSAKDWNRRATASEQADNAPLTGDIHSRVHRALMAAHPNLAREFAEARAAANDHTIGEDAANGAISEAHRLALLKALDDTDHGAEAGVYVYDVQAVDLLRSAVSAMLEDDAERVCAANGAMGEREALIVERDAAIMSTHCQALCIQQCAAIIGPETSATIDGLPRAVKNLVDERDQARAALTAEKVAGQEPVSDTHINLFRPNTGDVFKALRTDSIDELLQDGWEISSQSQPAQSGEQDERSTGICFFCGEPIDGEHESDCPQSTATQPVQDEGVLTALEPDLGEDAFWTWWKPLPVQYQPGVKQGYLAGFNEGWERGNAAAIAGISPNQGDGNG